MARTNIWIDDRLIRETIAVTGAKSKREAVEIALTQLTQRAALVKAFSEAQGKLKWQGNLKKLRKSRT